MLQTRCNRFESLLNGALLNVKSGCWAVSVSSAVPRVRVGARVRSEGSDDGKRRRWNRKCQVRVGSRVKSMGPIERTLGQQGQAGMDELNRHRRVPMRAEMLLSSVRRHEAESAQPEQRI